MGNILHSNTPMTYNTLLTRLYFLLVYADGSVNDKELSTARQMVRVEGFNEEEFNAQIKLLKSKDKDGLYAETMMALKQVSLKDQVRIIAWMCVIANADGFMDRSEWQLIYKIYHKELNLPLHLIFAVQKELNRKIWEKPTVIGL
ncbi:MAG TPA: TerB family tellurite resistance protein [Chryseosolibacter sp.]